jgi:hypothetical protein
VSVKTNEPYVEMVLRAAIAKHIANLEAELGFDVAAGNSYAAALSYEKLERAKELLHGDLGLFSKAVVEDLRGRPNQRDWSDS